MMVRAEFVYRSETGFEHFVSLEVINQHALRYLNEMWETFLRTPGARKFEVMRYPVDERTEPFKGEKIVYLNNDTWKEKGVEHKRIRRRVVVK